MEEKIDDADAYERRDTIILSGNDVPSATPGEIVSDIVCGVVRDRLKLGMDVTDISAAHRLGPKLKSQGPDRRKIIVKLCRRERKYDLITACKQTKPPNLFINENLAPTRNNILFSLRRAKKKFLNIVAACSSHDGKVYAWIKPPNLGRTPPNSIRISPPSHLHPPTHLHLHATAGVGQCILAHCNTDIYLSHLFFNAQLNINSKV